ncbi:hypothetical protein KUV73_19625 [Mameliella alba]|nr:hypothetical protein [Mameliella alba]MBY6176590.1 hypothetical protein [Mameliella alba]
MENAAAAGPRSGAQHKTEDQSASFQGYCASEDGSRHFLTTAAGRGMRKVRQSFSKLMHPPHLKLMKMLGYVLTLGTQEAWFGLVPVLKARLNEEERASLAFIALKSLDRENAFLTASHALSYGVGVPLPPLLTLEDEACFWVGMAATEELDVYGVAIFNAMSSYKKRDFLNFAGQQTA